MKKSDWIPVSQLPEQMEYNGDKLGFSHHVLVFDGNTKYVAYYTYITKEWVLAHGIRLAQDDKMLNSKPTHWMPLPENP